MTRENKFIKLVNDARLTAQDIPEFFDSYKKHLKDIFDVEITFTRFPLDIRMKGSSHETPIGKIGAFTQTQQDNPEIANENLAFMGTLEGTTKIPKTKSPTDETFSAVRLFWSFSKLDIDWIHGNPNTATYGMKNHQEQFKIPVTLFIEDFPKIWKSYRKKANIETMNKNLDEALNDYQNNVTKLSNKAIQDSTEIEDLETGIKDLQEMANKLTLIKNRIAKNITINTYKELPEMPEIESPLLNLEKYQDMKARYITKPDPDLQHEAEKLHQDFKIVQANANEYLTKYPEDFL